MTSFLNLWGGGGVCSGQGRGCCRNPWKNRNPQGGGGVPLVLRTRWPALLGAGGPLMVRSLLAESSRRRARTLLNRMRQQTFIESDQTALGERSNASAVAPSTQHQQKGIVT